MRSLLFAMTSVCAAQALLAGAAAAQDISPASSGFSLVCELQAQGQQDEGGRYWPTGSKSVLAMKLEAEGTPEEQLLDLYDPDNLLGPVVATRFGQNSEGVFTLVYDGSEDRHLISNRGSIIDHATIVRGEGELMYVGYCVSISKAMQLNQSQISDEVQ